MRKFLIIFITIISFTSCTEDELNSIVSGNNLSNEEIIEGLKSALSVGTDTSVSILNKLDGYYKDDVVKILLPDDAKAIYDNINKVPGGSLLLEETIKSLNRAAEDAAVAPLSCSVVENLDGPSSSHPLTSPVMGTPLFIHRVIHRLIRWHILPPL
jgi:hypothetical protein